jgi:hypothetical protein
MSKITTNDVRATVLALLVDRAERKLADRRPDFVVGFDVTRATRATLGWERTYDAVVAERLADAEAEYAAAVEGYERLLRAAVITELTALRATGLARVRLLLEDGYLTDELHRWAERQLAKAVKTSNPWSVAYLVLVLQDAAEWEADHDAYGDVGTEAAQASTDAYGNVRDTGYFDGGPVEPDLVDEVERTVYRAVAPLTFRQTRVA